VTQTDETTAVPPLKNDNFKLGIFCLNTAGGAALTTAEGQLVPTWGQTLTVAQAADEAGWEFLLSLGRWRDQAAPGSPGYGNASGRTLEMYTWCSALGALTRNLQVVATTHVPIFHPILVAKQSTTIDHVTSGRFAINVVAGWNEAEIRMFGGKQLPHDARYAAADEWMTIIKRLWTEEDDFSFHGEYYSIDDAYAMPKPVQQPHPVVISAGTSPAGMRFAAKHADIGFQAHPDPEELIKSVKRFKELALREADRDIEVLSHGYVVCRDTEKEAREYERYFVDEMGKWDLAERQVRAMAAGSMQSYAPGVIETMQRGLLAGGGGMPLVGTPEQIVDRLVWLKGRDVGGLALHWVDFEDGVDRFNKQVLPLMEDAGLRRPFKPEHEAVSGGTA
jgi:dimethylsulfone monooxygenase